MYKEGISIYSKNTAHHLEITTLKKVAEQLYNNLTSEKHWTGSITPGGSDSYSKGLGRDYTCSRSTSSILGFFEKLKYSCFSRKR